MTDDSSRYEQGLANWRKVLGAELEQQRVG
jgi:hypothetical protein